MIRFFLFSLLLVSHSTFAQRSFTDVDAQAVIDTFFEGFHEGDTTKMRSVIASEVMLQTVYTDNEGKHKINSDSIDGLLNAIANRPKDQKWDERLLSYTVQIDGNLAHVWTPYEFWFNGNFSHCGANAFTLAKYDDGWKIVHLIDSRRRETCRSE